MGGFGSGRTTYASTPTVRECRQLAANAFTDAVENPNTVRRVRWGEPEDPEGDIQVFIGGEADDERAPYIGLCYTVTDPRTGEQTEYKYRVALDYTECHFGGVRPWFRCPECDERRGKLYLPPRRERFACRECYDLGYQSSRTSGDDLKQAELRYRRAFAKADAEDRRPHPNNPPWTPTRPKGMHHDTFQELLEDVNAAREEWAQACDTRLRKLTNTAEKRLPGWGPE